MVALPELGTYTQEQRELARTWSPAFFRYEKVLSDPRIDDVHALRHQAWMKCVLATYFRPSSAREVCAYWSRIADELLIRAWRECGLDQGDSVLFALGKHGAEELNLSSDIDLMVVADPKNALTLEKGLRRFQQILHQPRDFGFCFRLDFDLRPGGKMGPWITSPAQFQDYYWSQGETWERLAMVRLRAVTGSPALQRQIQDLARRFSYRKFLDFTLLEDLKALRSQVHQKGFQRRDGELHVKLDVGGIRDIELFVHSLLVLNGGKMPELQTRSTAGALERLKRKKPAAAPRGRPFARKLLELSPGREPDSVRRGSSDALAHRHSPATARSADPVANAGADGHRRSMCFGTSRQRRLGPDPLARG
ncbi:MAG: hypothetical protein HC902_01820 [Calothrix sp. SM1_5_4]|nr:hypothetical protein [Calothrix sp. SM1_5_4]